MGAGFLRNGLRSQHLYAIQNLLHRHSTAAGLSIIRNGVRQNQPSQTFSRIPHFASRKARDLELSPPTIFRSPSMSSNSGIGFVGWYLGMIKSRPIVTKSLTSAVIYTAADLSSQTIAQPSSESFDLLRTLRMAGYGLLILGPILHFWFNSLSKILPKRDLIATLKKIVLGQVVCGPVMTVVFFSVNAALQGEDSSEIVGRLKRDLVPTLLRGVMYWPLCDFITFRFIPVHLQPLVSNSFSFLWTIYLTYMAGLEKAIAE